jgi:CubicO group peptidase (beta-lactamase class C family)
MMKNIINALLIGAAVGAVLACGGCQGGSSGGDSGTDSTDSTTSSVDWSAVDASLNGFVTPAAVAVTGQVVGYSFAVTNSEGTLYETAGGNQTIDTVLPIASATKAPSAIAILTLVDAGVLSLDEPVGTYFAALDPGFDWPADKMAITTRMLLSHTAGIPAPPDPSTSDCLSNTVTTLRACAQQIAEAPLDYPPATTFSYSGADYQVAGYLAQLISAVPFTSLFASAVAAPLGLSTFVYNDEQNPRVAGGGSCDVHDYSKILRMMLRGGLADDGTRVLSDAMVHQLESNQIAGDTYEPIPFLSPSQQSYFAPEYTLGLFVTNPVEYSSAGSPGPEFSDPGLYGTTPWLDAGLGYAAIILINQDVSTGLEMWTAVRPITIAQVAP